MNETLASRMFIDNERMSCPYCGYEYVSVGNPYSFSGNDDYSAAKVFNMEVRGDVLVLPCEGECGHKWVLALGFHKGQTYWKVVLNEQDDEVL